MSSERRPIHTIKPPAGDESRTVGENSECAGDQISGAVVRAQLDKILASGVFARSERMKRFLRLVVEAALNPEPSPVKEFDIAMKVFEKDESFDSRVDPIVRVEARRLRDKLREYYSGVGAGDPVLVSLGRSGYMAQFALRAPGPAGETVVDHAGTNRASTVADETAPRSPEAAPATQSSLAVLPFLDMSPEKNLDYFCDGITEELITALTRVPGLHVVSRSSSFRFRGEGHDVRKVGEELGVETVMEGSVRSAENRIRITAQLTKTVDGFHLWSEVYDETIDGIFEVQERIAQAIVQTLQVQRAEAESQSLTRRHTKVSKAYQLNLRGQYLRNKSNPADLASAVKTFQEAIAADPSYALAYAGLASCHCQLGWLGVTPATEAWPAAKAAALKALELDPELAAGHVALASARCVGDWNWPGGEEEFARAIELDPKDFAARHWHAVLNLAPAGRLDEALEEIRLARLLGPHSLLAHDHAGVLHLYRGQIAEAIQQHQWVLEQTPDFLPGLWNLGRALIEAGQFEEAAASLRRALDLSAGLAGIEATLANCLARGGMEREAIEIAARLAEPEDARYVPAVSLAGIFAGLRDADGVFEWLGKAIKDRSSRLIEIGVDPVFTEYRDDKRFNEVMKILCLKT